MTPSPANSEAEIHDPESKTYNTGDDYHHDHEESLSNCATSPQLPNNNSDISSIIPTLNISELKYDGKKPKWWKQLYGRRATKGQRRAMTCLEDQNYKLPKLQYGEMIDWNLVFPVTEKDEQAQPTKEIWLELGFGNGENLLVNSQLQDKNIGFVGAEVCQPGVGVVMKRMYEAIECGAYWSDYNLYTSDKDESNDNNVPTAIPTTTPNNAEGDTHDENHTRQTQQQQQDAKLTSDILTTKTPSPYENVRIYPGDGIKLLPSIPSSSISTLLVTFPDPFPKPSHRKHRLIQVHTLQAMYRILTKTSPVGRLFIATDHEGYFEWCLEIFDLMNSTTSTEVERIRSTMDGKETELKRRNDNADDNETSICQPARFRQVPVVPDRSTWLPAISKYEQKGWNEGRKTMLQCWEVVS
mmetsp:Transcript_31756/g.48707  ORF Transcript_31756/g.48707 Transcript_31756/m.48707 type:complete len:412 (+) Transcript_31756:121-1356(+)|eukprot:CAMPEP_0195290664 /NCGR_PEP_ID=MMETSP0707-20130614/6441_1 /TAXON_ID=33640 /ORGANISM="Asterionellopsis glacialis, Strain CCMP134" /LENGTH=411 /DNA_ID=CAMNT_0040350821 /DNA_START=63 /DNA_END=1298 /DNA_ORIENTATION=-